MARSIDNFLSKKEQDMISCFIDDNTRRWETFDRCTKDRPPPLDTTDLKKLRDKKYSKWDLVLSARMPGTPKTYRKFVDEQPLGFCAIKMFLLSFEDLFNEEKDPCDYKNILQDLKVGLEQCGGSCPFPAGTGTN
jgi:hypothetical protein